ncbi:MAG: acyltransferase family protein [Actinomycetota bacterium]
MHSTSRVNLPAIDGMRGVAALLILLTHVPLFILAKGPPRAVMMSFYMGVDLFFVLSGFVLFLPVALGSGRFGSKKAYFVRRAGRILPAYYVSLVIVIVLNSLLTNSRVALPQHSWRALLTLGSHLTLVQHELSPSSEGFGVNTVIWTLSIEALFYLLLPFVAAWYFKHPYSGLLLALGTGVLWKMAATHPLFTLPGVDYETTRVALAFQFPTYLGHFAMGMTAARVYSSIRASGLPKRLVRAVPAVQVGALLGLLYQMHEAGQARQLGRWEFVRHATGTTGVAACFALFLLCTVVGPSWSQWPLANRFSRWMGEISYGVYLYHLPIIGFAFTTLNYEKYGSSNSVVKMFMLAVPAAIFAGWISHIAVERPIYRRARDLSRRIEAPFDEDQQSLRELTGAIHAPREALQPDAV